MLPLAIPSTNGFILLKRVREILNEAVWVNSRYLPVLRFSGGYPIPPGQIAVLLWMMWVTRRRRRRCGGTGLRMISPSRCCVVVGETETCKVLCKHE